MSVVARETRTPTQVRNLKGKDKREVPSEIQK